MSQVAAVGVVPVVLVIAEGTAEVVVLVDALDVNLRATADVKDVVVIAVVLVRADALMYAMEVAVEDALVVVLVV